VGLCCAVRPAQSLCVSKPWLEPACLLPVSERPRADRSRTRAGTGFAFLPAKGPLGLSANNSLEEIPSPSQKNPIIFWAPSRSLGLANWLPALLLASAASRFTHCWPPRVLSAQAIFSPLPWSAMSDHHTGRSPSRVRPCRGSPSDRRSLPHPPQSGASQSRAPSRGAGFKVHPVSLAWAWASPHRGDGRPPP